MSRRKTHEEFIASIYGRPLSAVSKYKSAKTKIEFICHKCDFMWFATPDSVSSGSGCPKCAGLCGNDVVSRRGKVIELDISTPSRRPRVMLIDSDDYELIKSMGAGRICVSKNKSAKHEYAVTRLDGSVRLIHRLLIPTAECIDHKNTNGLDNRRSNLRACTKSENGMNRPLNKNNKSGCTGVYRISSSGKWASRIMLNRECVCLGNFDELRDAVSARKAAEERYFGEFAYSENKKGE